MKLNIYDKKYFVEYLEHPLKTWHLNKQKNSIDTLDYGWNTYIYNLQSRQGGIMSANLEGKMYKRYLEKFYREKGDLLEFNDYFSSKFLTSLAEEFYFLSGKELKTEKIVFEKYDKLASSVLIELLSCNKDSFNPDERVVIHAELKNVPTMHVKIFEFNSLNYYKKNCQPFKTDVNLDGFVTSFEKTLKFDDFSGQKKFKHTFEFDELDNKKGLFVIEFISNGYSSRAIVNKGTLSVIYKQRISGQIAYIIDENREICIGEGTGLYFKNQFFKADQDKGGRILIPFEKFRITDNAILVHNDFAQLVQFTRHAENYSLEVAYIIPPENLIMGNQASVILRPCLKVNNRKCTIESLSKTKVVITTTSFIDHVPVSKNFEDIQLKAETDLELNFSVPANLESVHISFETSIFNISQQKTERLTSSHTISMKTNNDKLTFYESHLRKHENKYNFYVLGKNGEPISNVDVLFNFVHSIYTAPNKQIQLTTNNMGIIDLGPLDGIKTVSSQIYLTTTPHHGNWNLSNTDQNNTFPDKIETLEGEEIEFPFIKAIKESKFSRDTFSLIRVSFNDKIITNLFDKAKYIPPKLGSFGLVKISGLEPGYYYISFNE
jgi:hypothetical protein